MIIDEAIGLSAVIINETVGDKIREYPKVCVNLQTDVR